MDSLIELRFGITVFFFKNQNISESFQKSEIVAHLYRSKKGWLIIAHGVGPIRRYCIAASLFDLDDPSTEIGTRVGPLHMPLENEIEGYVPNVVYSCGSIIHNNNLILPYAVSDYSTTYVVLEMAELFERLKE